MLKPHQKVAFIFLIASVISFFFSSSIAQSLESSISKEKVSTKNPIPKNPESIEKGKALYSQYCKGCHGPEAVREKNCPCTEKFCPANLRNAKLWRLGEGAIFWTIRDGRKPMPCFSDRTSEEECWHIVNYLHSLPPETKTGEAK